jgi:hypothetical protein
MIQLKFSVSKQFKNERLFNLLQKDDISINETILNYGVNLYENQGNIIKSLSIDNETEQLKNQIKILNKQYEDTIKNVQNEKDKEYELYKLNKDKEIDYIKTQKLKFENDLKLKFEQKENEFNEFVNKIEYDKLSIRQGYFKNVQDIENKLKEQYEIKIQSLQLDINKMQSEKTLEITSLIEKGKDITKNEYDKYIELQNKQINDLNSKITDLDSFIKTLHSKNEQLTEKIFEINKLNENNKYESIIGNLNVLNDRLNDNFDRFYKGTNTDKGDFGEKIIESYLTNSFSNCKIIDTHKETAFGDMLFIFDKVKCLIESKNVQTLKKEEIDKFYRDCELRASTSEINCSILISLNNTNLVNGKRHFVFEKRYGIGIIFISDVFKNQEYIRFSILILNYLINNGFSENDDNDDDEKMNFILNTINEIYTYFTLNMNYLNSDKQLLLKMQNSFKLRETSLYNIDGLFNNIFSKFPDFNINNSSNNKKSKNDIDDIINKIKTHIDISNTEFKINVKNLESIGISKHDIRACNGIKTIQDAFNDS